LPAAPDGTGNTGCGPGLETDADAVNQPDYGHGETDCGKRCIAQPGDKKEIGNFERKNGDQAEGKRRTLPPQVGGNRTGSQVLFFRDVLAALV
jgi:hypothetical protein